MLNLLQNEKLFNSQIYELFRSLRLLPFVIFWFTFQKYFFFFDFLWKFFNALFLHCTQQNLFFSPLPLALDFSIYLCILHLRFPSSFEKQRFSLSLWLFCLRLFWLFSISVVTAKFIFCPAILQLFAFTCNYSFCFWLVLENTFWYFGLLSIRFRFTFDHLFLAFSKWERNYFRFKFIASKTFGIFSRCWNRFHLFHTFRTYEFLFFLLFSFFYKNTLSRTRIVS